MSKGAKKPEIRKKTPKRLRLGMETSLNPVVNPAIEPIVRAFKAELQTLYGERLHGVVLYGSYARGNYNEESDIDLMVLLNDEQVNTYTEIRRMIDLETRFLLLYGKVISLLPASCTRYTRSAMPIYQEIRRYGLWL